MISNLASAAATPADTPSAVAKTSFGLKLDNGAVYSEIAEPLALQPGRHYLAEFNFNFPEAHGILQLYGTTFFRQYELPQSGNAKAFGSGPEQPHLLPLWTSSSRPELIHVRFVSADASLSNEQLNQFGSLTLRLYRPEALPVHVTSWIPYRASVNAPRSAWLETPRVFQSSYRAMIGGHPAAIRKSNEGLVMVAVPAGRSQVTLELHPPFALSLSFWISFIAVCASIGGIVAVLAGLLSRVRD
jgi:hypothetical protein